jgi:hypothetical protein
MRILEAAPNSPDEFSRGLAGSPRSHVGTLTRVVPLRAPWTHEAGLDFLVGCPRSGTAWLQAMLACHPDIYTGPETPFFGAYHPVEREYLREKDGRF